VLVATTPVFMTLSSTIDGPVSCLALLGAVSPLLTATTYFDWWFANLEAGCTVPNLAGFFGLIRINQLLLK